MTTQEKIKTIRDECIKANPEIVELELGCEIFRKGAPHREFFVGQFSNDYSLVRGDDIKSTWLPVTMEKPPESQEYKIIGRPIRLADVLLAHIRNGHTVESIYDIFSDWKLRDDDLSKQDENTIDSIYNLLK